jgi:hypothetical protein
MEKDIRHLLEHPLYKTMERIVQYMDRYYLDPVLGIVLPGGIGDTLSALLSLPFIWYSLMVVKSVPLTLAVLVNILRDIVLGMLPFFVGDVVDIFYRSYGRNFRLITGYVQGDRKTVMEVRRKTVLSVILIIVFIVLIVLLFKLVWMLAGWLTKSLS